ncbi:MAG: DUF3293 domain-containing protein [Acidobacteria bacterium]|nr:DUF3293 domain-containing protein [Acidobacteriota bacterium]
MAANRSFEEIYKAAEYVVEDGKRRFVIRVGETSGELDALLGEYQCETWAFISAHNPRSEELTPEENEARHIDFISYLNDHEYRYFAGYGQSPDGLWTPETSALVVNIARTEAIGIGTLFDQSAILIGRKGFSPELVWCDQGLSE